jgi:glutathione S-transferase
MNEFVAAQDAGTFPMGQIPMLEVTKGGKTVKLVQSNAIARYVAAETGLLGGSGEEAADVDSVVELVRDLKAKCDAAKDDAGKEAFINTTTKLLGYLEKLVGGGFAVGGKLSLADVYLYHFFTIRVAEDEKAQAVLQAHPKVAAVVAATAAVPGIAAWEAGRAARNEKF